MGNLLCKPKQPVIDEDKSPRGRRKKRNPLRWLQKHVLRRQTREKSENEESGSNPQAGPSASFISASFISGASLGEANDIDCQSTSSEESDIDLSWRVRHGIKRAEADTPVAGSDSFVMSRVNPTHQDYDKPDWLYKTVVGGTRPSKTSMQKLTSPSSLTDPEIEDLYEDHIYKMELWAEKQKMDQKCASPAFPDIPSRYTTFPPPRRPSLYEPTRVSDFEHEVFAFRPMRQTPLRAPKPHINALPDCARVSFPPTNNFQYRQKDAKDIPGEHPWTRPPSFRTFCPPLAPSLLAKFHYASILASMEVLPQDKQIELVKREEGVFPGLIVYKDESTPEMFRLELPEVVPASKSSLSQENKKEFQGQV